jgi:nucleoside-diphosphate-sugar epimerase
MILWNGSSGSLGAYFGPAVAARSQQGSALRARLADRAALLAELDAVAPRPTAGARLLFVHMAAMVSVPACEREPEQALQTNVTDSVATVRAICDWARGKQLDPAVVYVSTGHVYAAQPAGTLVSEAHPTAPRSVYARTKLEAERRLQEACAALGVSCLVARVFGLLAPKQPPHYVLPGLIRRVREEQVQAVPGLSFVRDYLDARDVCRVLLDLAQLRPFPEGVLNLCSGEPLALRDLITLIIRTVQPSAAERLIGALGEAPARPDDIPWIVGDAARLTALLGRGARHILPEQTLRDALMCEST